MSSVTVAVMQTAALPGLTEIVPTVSGPILWEGRLAPNLIAPLVQGKTPSDNLRAGIRWSAALRLLSPPPYGAGTSETVGRFFKTLDDEYDDWLFEHLNSQINALLAVCDRSAGRLRRPDVVILPEYSVTAQCAIRLGQVAEAGRMTLIAGTHAWRTKDWSNYPLKDYVDSDLDAFISRLNHRPETYLSFCPIFLFTKNGQHKHVIPKLLRSTYEKNLVTPLQVERAPCSFDTAAGSALKIALHICSEFIRHPVSDDEHERRAYDSVVQGQAEAAIVAIPAYTPDATLFEKDFESHFGRVRNPRNVFAFANIAAFGHSAIATRDSYDEAEMLAEPVGLDPFAEAAVIRTIELREGDNKSLLPSHGPEHVIFFPPESPWLAGAIDSLESTSVADIQDHAESLCPAYRTLALELRRKGRFGAVFARNNMHWAPIAHEKILAINIRKSLLDLYHALQANQHDRQLDDLTAKIAEQVSQISQYWGLTSQCMPEITRTNIRWLWNGCDWQSSSPRRKPWPLSLGMTSGVDRGRHVTICCGVPAELIKAELQNTEQHIREVDPTPSYGRRDWAIGHPSHTNAKGVIWPISDAEGTTRDELSGVVERHFEKADNDDNLVGPAVVIALPNNTRESACKFAAILKEGGCCARSKCDIGVLVVTEASLSSALDTDNVASSGAITGEERELFDVVLQFQSNRITVDEIRRMEDRASKRRKEFLCWLRNKDSDDNVFFEKANIKDVRIALLAGLFGIPGRDQHPNEIRRAVSLIKGSIINEDLRLALASLPVSRPILEALVLAPPVVRAVAGLVTAAEAAARPVAWFDVPVGHWRWRGRPLSIVARPGRSLA